MNVNKTQFLEDALRRELGTFRDLNLPEPDSKKRWVSLSCLFCQGKRKKKTAAINYDLGLYKCLRCEVKVSAGKRAYRQPPGCLPGPVRDPRVDRDPPEFRPDESAISKFRFPIWNAAYDVARKWTSLDYDDILLQAMEFATNYVRGKLGGAHDAGKARVWEAEVGGDADKLDRYVYKALYCDLINWCKHEVKKQEYAAGKYAEEILIPPEALSERASSRLLSDLSWVDEVEKDYPVLTWFHVDKVSLPDIARKLGVSVAKVKRIKDEELERCLKTAGRTRPNFKVRKSKKRAA